jgi:hypothetical protein
MSEWKKPRPNHSPAVDKRGCLCGPSTGHYRRVFLGLFEIRGEEPQIFRVIFYPS